MNNTETLGDALPQEIQRCRELVRQYESIGPVGMFGKTMIEGCIADAESAIQFGDTVGMLRAYNALKGCE